MVTENGLDCLSFITDNLAASLMDARGKFGNEFNRLIINQIYLK